MKNEEHRKTEIQKERKKERQNEKKRKGRA